MYIQEAGAATEPSETLLLYYSALYEVYRFSTVCVCVCVCVCAVSCVLCVCVCVCVEDAVDDQ